MYQCTVCLGHLGFFPGNFLFLSDERRLRVEDAAPFDSGSVSDGLRSRQCAILSIMQAHIALYLHVYIFPFLKDSMERNCFI